MKEIILTLDPNGAVLDVEVPDGVVLTLDRVDDAGRTETTMFGDVGSQSVKP